MATIKKREGKTGTSYLIRSSCGYDVSGKQVMRSMAYAYVGRKLKKREYRQLWIARINAGARMCGMSYSRMIDGLKKAGVDVNRKVLADLAVNDMPAFEKLAETAKEALA